MKVEISPTPAGQPTVFFISIQQNSNYPSLDQFPQFSFSEHDVSCLEFDMLIQICFCMGLCRSGTQLV